MTNSYSNSSGHEVVLVGAATSFGFFRQRSKLVADYGQTHIDLVRTLDWDYVRVPAAPKNKTYSRPQMTGPHSWIDDEGNEVCFYAEHGSIITRAERRDMTIDDLPDPDDDFRVDPSEMDIVRTVVSELKDSHFIIGRPPVDGTFAFVVLDNYLAGLKMVKEYGKYPIGGIF